MTSNFDSDNIGAVTALQERVAALTAELRRSQQDSKWKPIITSTVDAGGAKISLRFGNKTGSAVLSAEALRTVDLTTLTTSVLEIFFQHIIADELRKVVADEIQKTVSASQSLSSAGKW